MALIYHNFSQLDSALHYYLEAIEMASKLEKVDRLALLYNNTGIIFGQQGQFDKSMDYFSQGRDLAFEMQDTTLMVQSYLNIGRWYIESGNAAVGADTIIRAYEWLDGSDRGSDIISVLSFLGYAYERQGKTELAESTLIEAYKLAAEERLLKDQAEIAVWLGQTYNDQKKYRQALTHILAGMAIAESQNLREFQKDSYLAASVAYEGIGDFAQALDYQKKYSDLYADIFSETSNRLQAEQEAIFQNHLKERENLNLKKQALDQQRIINSRTYLLAAISIIVALLLIIAYNAYKARAKVKQTNILLEERIKEKTSALVIKNKELEQSNSELQSFAYIASHDMKEPLRNINSYIELLGRTLPEGLNENSTRYFEGIKRNSTDLYRLVEDVLQFTIQDQQEVEIEEVNFCTLMKKVVESCQTLKEEKNAVIQYQSLPTLLGNAGHWFIILKNLIENGIKYNRSEVPTIDVRYYNTSEENVLEVKDNGIGIDQKFHDRIFGMFKRLHTRKEFEGTGLGLATCKKIMEQMGGSITVESGAGEGSSFICTWPKNTI
jgi:signal transduction histidine kinase